MAFEFLTYERKEQICYLTLNRPEKLNALNQAVLELGWSGEKVYLSNTLL